MLKINIKKNIHPCTEKTIIKILSGIITVFYAFDIFILFIAALMVNKDLVDNYSSNSFDSSSLDDMINIVRILLFVFIIIICIPFVFMLLIFINSFHIN